MTTETPLATEASGLQKSFGEVRAVDGVEGNVSGGDIAIVLATTAALTAVFAPLTNHLYRTRS